MVLIEKLQHLKIYRMLSGLDNTKIASLTLVTMAEGQYSWGYEQFSPFPDRRKWTPCLISGGWDNPLFITIYMTRSNPLYNLSASETKELLNVLRNMETSLQILANSKNSNTTTAFVNRKALAARLGVQPIFIDKLVYQGLTSQGTSGLVEKRHYCKLDPEETNISNFLFDSVKVLNDAWNSFSNY